MTGNKILIAMAAAAVLILGIGIGIGREVGEYLVFVCLLN